MHEGGPSGSPPGLASQAFWDAASLASEVVGSGLILPCWGDASQVEGFSVGGLAAHLYAGVRRLEVALDETLPDKAVTVGVVDFYGANRIGSAANLGGGIHAAIVRDAERRAEQGPAALREQFVEVLGRLRRRLPLEPAGRLVLVMQVAGGVTPLTTYLATRVVELVVHADDLAVSAGLPPLVIPQSASSTVIDVCVELARARAGDLGVIRAFTRGERAGHDDLRVL